MSESFWRQLCWRGLPQLFAVAAGAWSLFQLKKYFLPSVIGCRRVTDRRLRKLQTQIALLTRKNGGLEEFVLRLEQEIVELSQSKQAVEAILLKRIGALEDELEAKEREMDALKCNPSADSAMVEDAWLINSLPQGSWSCRNDASAWPEETGYHSDDAVQEPTPMTSTQAVMDDLSSRISQQLISDVKPSTMILDIDDFYLKNVSLLRSDIIMTIVLDAFLVFIQQRHLMGNSKKMDEFWDAYAKVVDRYRDQDDGQRVMHVWQSFIVQHQVPEAQVLKSLLSLYKSDLVDDLTVLEWYTLFKEGDATKKVFFVCQPFISWLQTQVDEDEDSDVSVDETTDNDETTEIDETSVVYDSDDGSSITSDTTSYVSSDISQVSRNPVAFEISFQFDPIPSDEDEAHESDEQNHSPRRVSFNLAVESIEF